MQDRGLGIKLHRTVSEDSPLNLYSPSDTPLHCVVCQDLMEPPATLPCGHSGCKHCLVKVWVRTPRCFIVAVAARLSLC